MSRSFFIFLMALSLSVGLTALMFQTPGQVQAGPLAGFTPQPPPPPPPAPPPAPNPSPDHDKHNDDPPAHNIGIRLDQCQLTCSTNDNPEASISLAAAPETQVGVQLVHDGSGFIVEGMLSDQRDTFFALPYPGLWRVFMTTAPQFVTAQTVSVSDSNLAQLQAEVAVNPVFLGEVEADAPAAQVVSCPISCPATPAIEPAPYLPETGTNTSISPLSVVLAFVGLVITCIGTVVWLLNHKNTHLSL